MLKRLSYACCLLFVLVSYGYAEKQIIRPGIVIPAVELPSINNGLVSIDSYLGKKVLILSFFASWSDTCVQELKYLQKLYDDYKDKVEILAVSFDSNAAKVQAFASKNKFTFTILIDKKRQCIDKFQILLIPCLIVVGNSYLIADIFDDFDENIEKSIDKQIKSLISSK